MKSRKGFEESAIACGIIAHYATCLADTLASELGILSKSDPFFIVQPWKKVPPGTNGGVTLGVFFWMASDGMLKELCSWICSQEYRFRHSTRFVSLAPVASLDHS